MGCVQRMPSTAPGTQEARDLSDHRIDEVSQLSHNQRSLSACTCQVRAAKPLVQLQIVPDALVRCPCFQRQYYSFGHSGSQDFLSIPCLALWGVLSKYQCPKQIKSCPNSQSPQVPSISLHYFPCRATQVAVNYIHSLNQRGCYLHNLLWMRIDYVGTWCLSEVILLEDILPDWRGHGLCNQLMERQHSTTWSLASEATLHGFKSHTVCDLRQTTQQFIVAHFLKLFNSDHNNNSIYFLMALTAM